MICPFVLPFAIPANVSYLSFFTGAGGASFSAIPDLPGSALAAASVFGSAGVMTLTAGRSVSESGPLSFGDADASLDFAAALGGVVEGAPDSSVAAGRFEPSPLGIAFSSDGIGGF